jgi:hypothetical protein
VFLTFPISSSWITIRYHGDFLLSMFVYKMLEKHQEKKSWRKKNNLYWLEILHSNKKKKKKKHYFFLTYHDCCCFCYFFIVPLLDYLVNLIFYFIKYFQFSYKCFFLCFIGQMQRSIPKKAKENPCTEKQEMTIKIF